VQTDLTNIRCPCELQALVNLGARKFILSNVGPLGCIPYRMTLDSTKEGQCVQSDNSLVAGFNVALKSLVDEFNGRYPNAKFVLANSYNVVSRIINNPTSFGMYILSAIVMAYPHSALIIFVSFLSISGITRGESN